MQQYNYCGERWSIIDHRLLVVFSSHTYSIRLDLLRSFCAARRQRPTKQTGLTFCKPCTTTTTTYAARVCTRECGARHSRSSRQEQERLTIYYYYILSVHTHTPVCTRTRTCTYMRIYIFIL